MPHNSSFQFFVDALRQARRDNLAAMNEPPPIAEPYSGWSRRRFLRAAAAFACAMGSGTLAASLPKFARAASPSQPRIAIIGAGLAGLNAARHLRRLGIDSVVFEAQSRLGGRVLSADNGIAPGLILDIGGSLINSDHEDMIAIAREVGEPLFDRKRDMSVLEIPPVAYVFDGQRRAVSEVAAALRPLAAQISTDAALLDEDFDNFAPKFDALSVKDYLNRHADKIQEPYVRSLIETIVRAEYGVEPEQSAALQLLFLLPVVKGQQVELLSNSDEAYFVKSGAGALIQGCSRELDGQIRLGSQLIRLEQTPDGHYRLTFKRRGRAWPDNGDSKPKWAADTESMTTGDERQMVIEADYVILTLPFPVLRDVDLALQLPRELRDFIDESELGRNEKVFAGFEERAWRQPHGFGLDLWNDAGFCQVWDESQRQVLRRDGALTFYTGGADADKLAGIGADTAGANFVDRLNRVLPGLTDAASDTYLRTRWSRGRFSRGAFSSFGPGQLTRFANFFWIESSRPSERQEVRVGNLYFAGEHLSDAFHGYMNGAAQTGRLAAEALIGRLKEGAPASKALAVD